MGTPVLQPRCTHCLREHYGPAVWAISHGAACPTCARTRIYFDAEEYRRDLRDAQDRQRRRDRHNP